MRTTCRRAEQTNLQDGLSRVDGSIALDPLQPGIHNDQKVNVLAYRMRRCATRIRSIQGHTIHMQPAALQNNGSRQFQHFAPWHQRTAMWQHQALDV